MKKYADFLLLSSLTLLLCILDILFVPLWGYPGNQNRLIGVIGVLILLVWALGSVFLFFRKNKQKRILSKFLIAGNSIFLSILLVFCLLFLLAVNHNYTGSFSIDSALFENKKVMIIVPHQDDDINLAGGLIEQYTQGNSTVSVVFSTNGDLFISAEPRANEVVAVLTPLGVKKEDIYYLGFGDQWQPQIFEETTVPHIYNSIDPDSVWTSRRGATATYGTQSIPCYLSLPYTRNNFLYSLQAIIQDKKPDVIFAVDSDPHSDHAATGLLFEEALCRVLRDHPDYHPLVYKGFCYGTAWDAVPDFHDNLNLLSTQKPNHTTWSISSFGYAWEDRVRFPMSSSNLNIVLLNNSVYRSFNAYSTQFAHTRAEAVLNGDKVFWERRTDSLLYNATILVDGQATSLLNDFKLKDFTDVNRIPATVDGVAFLNNAVVQVSLEDTVTANCLYLYDNPSQTENILEGYISFSDGSTIEFGELRQDGSATIITFPEKQITWFEIVPTKTTGDFAGLSEVELYHNARATATDTFLMAVDPDDNFAYDYMIHTDNSASFRLCRFPRTEPLSKEDVTITFESDNASNSYHWDNDSLTVNCAAGSTCTITVSAGEVSTTFSVSNPYVITRVYLAALNKVGDSVIHAKWFLMSFFYSLSRFVH